MTGLDKILKTIEEQAEERAREMIAQANKVANDILAAAQLEAEKKCSQIAEKSAIEVQAAINRAESAAALQEKKILLEAKQQVIGTIIMKARTSLANLPEDEFVENLLTMIQKYAHNKQGIILFSAVDKKRLPKDFNDRVKTALSKKPEASLTVAEEVVKIDGGFLLKYGDIEENCSFEALFSAAKENLQDKVNSLLFE